MEFWQSIMKPYVFLLIVMETLLSKLVLEVEE